MTGAYCQWGNGVAVMPTVGEADIYVDKDIKSVAFTANGEYIVGGDDKGVGVWRRSGQKLATLAATYVQIVAVSRDGRWIAAGTFNGSAIVWDAKTYERVLTVDGTGHSSTINGVDFSPDSARLVTASKSCTATVYDVTNRTHARPRQRGDSSEILAPGRPDRNNHQLWTRSSLGQQRWPLARAHPGERSLVGQHVPPLVQQPPLCRVQH